MRFKVDVTGGKYSHELVYVCPECDLFLNQAENEALDIFEHPATCGVGFLWLKQVPSPCSLAGKKFRLQILTVEGIEC